LRTTAKKFDASELESEPVKLSESTNVRRVDGEKGVDSPID